MGSIPQTEAALVDRIETVWSDVNWLVAKLVQDGVIPEHPGKLPRPDAPVCSTLDYVYRVYDNARLAWEGSRKVIGGFEFGICQHCLHTIGFTFEGWHSCGNCGKLLWIEFNGSKWWISRDDQVSDKPTPPEYPPQASDAGASAWNRGQP